MPRAGQVISRLQNGLVSWRKFPPMAVVPPLTHHASNLMARDDFKNLGFNQSPDNKKPGGANQESVKGELRW